MKGFVWMNMYLVVGKFFVVLNIVWFEEYLVNEFINWEMLLMCLKMLCIKDGKNVLIGDYNLWIKSI